MAVVLCCPQGTVLDVNVLSPTNGVGCPQGMALDATVLSPKNGIGCHCIVHNGTLLDVPKEWRWCPHTVPKE